MAHINLKSAAKVAMHYTVDVAAVDLPRVNASLSQLAALDTVTHGPLEDRTAPPEYPGDVLALGLPAVPRFYGELAFSICPGTKLTLIVGTLTAQVPMRCQSCLSAFIRQIHIEIKLAHIYSQEQESTVPTGYDSLVFDRQDLTLAELVEDDILLSLPSFPRHSEGQCDQDMLSSREALEPREDKRSPFAGLKALLHSTDEH